MCRALFSYYLQNAFRQLRFSGHGAVLLNKGWAIAMHFQSNSVATDLQTLGTLERVVGWRGRLMCMVDLEHGAERSKNTKNGSEPGDEREKRYISGTVGKAKLLIVRTGVARSLASLWPRFITCDQRFNLF